MEQNLARSWMGFWGMQRQNCRNFICILMGFSVCRIQPCVTYPDLHPGLICYECWVKSCFSELQRFLAESPVLAKTQSMWIIDLVVLWNSIICWLGYATEIWEIWVQNLASNQAEETYDAHFPIPWLSALTTKLLTMSIKGTLRPLTSLWEWHLRGWAHEQITTR